MDDFQHFEPFSPDTLMEMSEQSYAQEIISKPVPFQNRVDFLSDFDRTANRALTARSMSKLLNIDYRIVESMAKTIGASFSEGLDTDNPLYESHTLEVIAEELIWQEAYKEMPCFVSATKIGTYLGKNRDWVKRNAYELALYPERVDMPYGKQKPVYSKTAALLLRELSLHSPPAGGWYTQEALHNAVGKSVGWVKKQLKKYEVESSPRIAAASSEVVPHYPPEVLTLLQGLVLEIAPPAWDWMTAWGMSQLFGRSQDWVEARLKPYAEFAELRTDIVNKPYMHYPPSVVKIIDKQVNELPPPGDGWFTSYAIKNMLRVGETWLHTVLKKYQSVAEMRLSPGNKPALHYSPEIVEEIEELAHHHYGAY